LKPVQRTSRSLYTACQLNYIENFPGDCASRSVVLPVKDVQARSGARRLAADSFVGGSFRRRGSTHWIAVEPQDEARLRRLSLIATAA
jgi:hypothetical protein